MNQRSIDVSSLAAPAEGGGLRVLITNRVAAAVSKAAEPLVAGGHQLVVLPSPSVRAQVKQILHAQIPGATVPMRL